MYGQEAKVALLDLYEQALLEIGQIIEDIPNTSLSSIIGLETTDENCTSFQTFLSHIVRSGYWYAIYIHNRKENKTERPETVFHTTIKEYLQDFNKMKVYTENVYKDLNDDQIEELDTTRKIFTSWQQHYDTKQLMKHAIVLFLFHKRHIEKFKNTTKTTQININLKIS